MEDAVFVNWKGITYMRPYKKQKSVNSPKQVEVRMAFSSVPADWKYLPGLIAETWTDDLKVFKIKCNIQRQARGFACVFLMQFNVLVIYDFIPGCKL
jgi:hypothetical protein